MLRIRGICEGNPEARLVRLLGRQKFEEAEKFAKLNNLPLEEVYCSQAAFLMNKLTLSNMKKADQANIFHSLEQVLEKITDQNFIIQCCLTAKFDDLKLTRKMLLMARRKNLGLDVTDVNKALHKLDTFIFVHGMENDSIENSWMNFSKVDMLDEMKALLEQGCITKSLIIWNRHQAGFNMNAGAISGILNALPRPMIENRPFLDPCSGSRLHSEPGGTVCP